MKTAMDCINALHDLEAQQLWGEYLIQGSTKHCLVADILQELGFDCRAVRSTFVIDIPGKTPMFAVASGVEIEQAGKRTVIDLVGNTGKAAIQRAFAKTQNGKRGKHPLGIELDLDWELMTHVPNVTSIGDEAYARQKTNGLALLRQAVELHAATPDVSTSTPRPRF